MGPDDQPRTSGNSGPSSGAPCASLTSRKGGEVTPSRTAKVAPSPTQRLEKARRRRCGERFGGAPCKVRKVKATASPGSSTQRRMS